MVNRLTVLLWATIVAILPAPLPALAQVPPSTQTGIVLRVVDGDTVDVQLVDGRSERLRLIGMDTPELVDPRKPVQCYAREASGRAHQILDGQAIAIAGDPTQDTRDRYGRLLAYLWRADGLFYNQQMIADGYAHEYTYRFPYQYQAAFRAAEQAAQAQQLGLWSPATCTGNTNQAVDAPPLATGSTDDSGSAAEQPTPPPSQSGQAAPISLSDCPTTHPIKGNASSMIYHVPGGAFYSRTNPEVCFATEADAVAAGYRRSQR